MKQQCHIAILYLSWALYVTAAVLLAAKSKYFLAAVWLIGVPIALWAYILIFPRISRYMGYGTVEDEQPVHVQPASSGVTFYSAVGCPFCPIVEKRIESLQKQMGFTLEKVDVTLRPQLLTEKKIQAVPVVEVGDQRITGNATSSQLAALIAPGNQRTRVVSRKG